MNVRKDKILLRDLVRQLNVREAEIPDQGIIDAVEEWAIGSDKFPGQETIDRLVRLGIKEDDILIFLAAARSEKKYGYRLSVEKTRKVVKLARDNPNDRFLEILIECPFGLAPGTGIKKRFRQISIFKQEPGNRIGRFMKIENSGMGLNEGIEFLIHFQPGIQG